MPRVLLLLLLCAVCAPLRATALIRVGDAWRYYPAITAPPAAWRDTEFIDTNWSSGPSGFSAGIYGRMEEATLLYGFPWSYQTVYLRRTFGVADTNSVQWLTLRADWDDGFIAYLNGVEVARRGMTNQPGSEIPFTSPAATTHHRAQTEEIDLTAWKHLLRAGKNVLAVQVHNSPGTAQNSFCWAAELLANFTRGPLLQNASTNAIQIVFRTATPVQATVTYSLAGGVEQTVRSPSVTNHHALWITNLPPGARHTYNVTIEANGVEAVSATHSFETLRDSGPASMLLLGDAGAGSQQQMLLSRLMKQHDSQLVVSLGDVVYPYFIPALEDFRCFSIYAEQMASIPFYFAAGNHDGYAHRPYFFQAFYLPTNSATGSEEFYSFDHGEAHIIVLDTDLQVGARYDPESIQYKWLEADLAATRKRWKIIMFHHVIRSSALHHWDDYNANGIYDEIQLQQSIGRLAEKYGVQLIVTGHDHTYERFKPVNGVVTIVTGGGGEDLYPLAILHPASARFRPAFHFVRVDYDEKQLHVRAIGEDERLIDEFYLHEGDSLPREPLNASWNTPTIEEGPANDNDGNIIGQTFDFIGTPHHSSMGSASSLGRMFVNNDSTNLYIGFANAALPRGADLLLFLGAANTTTGVTNMTGIGNGTTDPALQGADALDEAENLAFKDFQPTLAAILGDERADGTFPAFARSETRSGGQGVFKLTADLEPIAGTRLQQFNISPQNFAFTPDDDADFIELAIPLSALPELTSDRLIRIAAVVALDSTNMVPATRQFDSAAIGTVTNQLEHYTVEAITVRLSANTDPDGDGLQSERELALGTDPNNRDTDADTLPDGWEVSHELDPLSSGHESGALGDPDRDLASNAHEFAAGTDPRNANSVFSVSITQPLSNQTVLSWQGVAGRRYVVEQSPEPSAPAARWSPGLAEPLSGADESLTFTVQVDASANARYYRIRLSP